MVWTLFDYCACPLAWSAFAACDLHAQLGAPASLCCHVADECPPLTDGEPPVGGPEVSSTYGQYDLCGFPKAAAFWYRVQWLLTIPDNPDKVRPLFSALFSQAPRLFRCWPLTAALADFPDARRG